MTRIALLSDTHGYLDDRCISHLSDCDEIWHAGDIGSLEVAMKLEQLHPLHAVYGNCDGGDLRRMYPQVLRWKCEEVDVMMTHIGGYPGKYDASIRQNLMARPPQLFISGHSHILKVMPDIRLGLLHINPGAAGLQGWHQVRTIVRFEIDGDKIDNLEVIEMER